MEDTLPRNKRHLRARNVSAARNFNDIRLHPLEGLSVVFYIDNNNAIEAVVKNSATPLFIRSRTALIWHRVSDLRISARFGRFPSKRNVTDLPKRRVAIPYKTSSTGAFKNLNTIHSAIKQAMGEIKIGNSS